jgi:1-acyl-sn-glycerol-3-phosphate acyltransferase
MDMDRALRTDFYYWRLFATGFCFATFGIGSVVLGLAITSLLRLALWNRERRERTVHLLVHLSFRTFIGLMHLLGVLTYEVHGRQYLREPGQLVIANHPTLIDVIFLVACIPNAVCVVKEELLRSFGLGLLLRRAGYVGNAADPHISLDQCVAAMRGGATLIMFPEGSRSVPGSQPRLRRGAAYVALAAQKELTPVHISCKPSTLTKSERWYDIPNRRMHFVISVGHRIPIAAPGDSTSQRVTAKDITERVRRILLQEAPAYD